MSRDTTSSLQRKKNLKWFQSRIENFNSVVRYHIDGLNTIKTNIRKHHRLENMVMIRQELTSADRSIRQLKQLLVDIDNLKDQVETSDHDKFEQLVSSSRKNIKIVLCDFERFVDILPLEIKETKPLPDYIDNDQKENNDDNGSNQIVVQMAEDRWELENQLEIANSVQKIEQDAHTINQIFRDLHQIFHEQQEKVDSVENSVEISHAEVVAAEKELVQVAAKVKGAMYPLVGAIVGTCIGGPIGCIGGLKIGAVIAFTGSIIGFSGGKVLKMKEQAMQKRIIKDLDQTSTTA